jgi:pimeloyl-ACP methyl ester carboxylesterase
MREWYSEARPQADRSWSPRDPSVGVWLRSGTFARQVPPVVEASAASCDGRRVTEQTSLSPIVDTGFVELGALRMYYEVHGHTAGRAPLVLLHGGLFDIDQQFGALIPDLAAGRRVIAVDFQGHGRTNDIDRPFSAAAFAGDVLGVLDHLGVGRADILGFSVGGAVALELAIAHPERVRKVIVSSASFAASGMRGSENADAVGSMTVDMIAGTPMEASYLAKSPHPDREHLQGLLDKLGATYTGGFPDRTEAEIRGIEAPTLITVGDADMVSLEHAVQFLRLRGGDVNGDFVGVPASHLAVFPGTTHFFGLARTDLVRDVVVGFLDE